MRKKLLILATILTSCSNVNVDKENISITQMTSSQSIFFSNSAKSSISKNILSSVSSEKAADNKKLINFTGDHTAGLQIEVPKNSIYENARIDTISFYNNDELFTILYFGDSSLNEDNIDRSKQLYPGVCSGPEDYTIVNTIKKNDLLIHEIDYPCERLEAPTYIIEREYNNSTVYLKVQMTKEADVKIIEPYLSTLRSVE